MEGAFGEGKVGEVATDYVHYPPSNPTISTQTPNPNPYSFSYLLSNSSFYPYSHPLCLTTSLFTAQCTFAQFTIFQIILKRPNSHAYVVTRAFRNDSENSELSKCLPETDIMIGYISSLIQNIGL